MDHSALKINSQYFGVQSTAQLYMANHATKLAFLSTHMLAGYGCLDLLAKEDVPKTWDFFVPAFT